MSKETKRLDEVEVGIKWLRRKLATQGECIQTGHDLIFDSACCYDLSGIDTNQPTWIRSKCSRCEYTGTAQATECEKKAMETLNIKIRGC